MRSFRHHADWIILAGICTIALFGSYWFPKRQNFSGNIRRSSAIDSKPTFQEVLSGRRTIGTFQVGDLLSSDDIYIRLGPSKLEWSIGTAESGYLYSATADTKRGDWEFAPCPKKELSEVHSGDIPCEFYGKGHSDGANIFGEDWLQSGSVVRVHLRNLIFARQTGVTNVVYGMKLKSQGPQGVQVEYLEIKSANP